MLRVDGIEGLQLRVAHASLGGSRHAAHELQLLARCVLGKLWDDLDEPIDALLA